MPEAPQQCSTKGESDRGGSEWKKDNGLNPPEFKYLHFANFIKKQMASEHRKDPSRPWHVRVQKRKLHHLYCKPTPVLYRERKHVTAHLFFFLFFFKSVSNF